MTSSYFDGECCHIIFINVIFHITETKISFWRIVCRYMQPFLPFWQIFCTANDKNVFKIAWIFNGIPLKIHVSMKALICIGNPPGGRFWLLVRNNNSLKWCDVSSVYHDDVIKWTFFPRYWPFVRGIHWSPIDSPYKDQWPGSLMFSLFSTWTNGWTNNRDAGDLRRHCAHYDVTVMCSSQQSHSCWVWRWS